MSHRPHPVPGLVVTRTITRVLVAERKGPEPQKDGCGKSTCGCLMLIVAILLILGLVGSCVGALEGQESARPAIQA